MLSRHIPLFLSMKVVRHSKYKLFSLLLWLKYDPTTDGPRIMRLSNKVITIVTTTSDAHLPLGTPANIFRRYVIHQQEDYAPKNPSHLCSAVLMSLDEQMLLKEYVKSHYVHQLSPTDHKRVCDFNQSLSSTQT